MMLKNDDFITALEAQLEQVFSSVLFFYFFIGLFVFVVHEVVFYQ